MKKYPLQKKVYWINFVQFWIFYSDIYFFFANISYFNFQINFQSSHLTKKETENASKRLSPIIAWEPSIHINPNSYSFSLYLIFYIIVLFNVYNHYRTIFFIICFINGWKYDKVATNWDRVTNWCVYLIHVKIYYRLSIK